MSAQVCTHDQIRIVHTIMPWILGNKMKGCIAFQTEDSAGGNLALEVARKASEEAGPNSQRPYLGLLSASTDLSIFLKITIWDTKSLYKLKCSFTSSRASLCISDSQSSRTPTPWKHPALAQKLACSSEFSREWFTDPIWFNFESWVFFKVLSFSRPGQIYRTLQASPGMKTRTSGTAFAWASHASHSGNARCNA